MNDDPDHRKASPLRATYRLQLSGQFSLAAVRELVAYLDRLGISHVYSSPLLHARRGSTHGYDVVDPTSIDPEIGSEEDLRSLVAMLRRQAMGLILDIVPNHMAATWENPAWDDVLAHGPSSRFAHWFDIAWDDPHPSRRGRVVLPVLGDVRSRALARGQLVLYHDEATFRVRYFERSFPIDPATVPLILGKGLASRDQDRSELIGILDALRRLPPRTAGDPTHHERRHRESLAALERLKALLHRSEPVRTHVDGALAALGASPGCGRLRGLLDAQAYRLVHWRRAPREINYRRFFTINDLVGVRVEDPAVFMATHAVILRWAAEGLLDGVRVDHIDGLLDPRDYLERFQTTLAQAHPLSGGIPIYVEKILGHEERLHERWPVAGTTGYEFLNEVEAIFLSAGGFTTIQRWYRRAVAPGMDDGGFPAMVAEAKRRMLRIHLAADVERLRSRLAAIAQQEPAACGLSADDLSTAIIEVMAHLDVYRTYVDGRAVPVDGPDRRTIEAAVAAARRHGGALPTALDLLRRTLLLEGPVEPTVRTIEDQLAFVLRFQQTSGAAMAKGLEDTILYVWIPLASLNDVGGGPHRPLHDTVASLHAANLERAARWPTAMLCTSTHDTKRSADVRARLDVLSEIPLEWTTQVERWYRLNRRHRRRVRGRLAPDANTEYLVYQTLVGIWPLPEHGQHPEALPDDASRTALRGRLTAYMRKAAREAKIRTRWIAPNPEFEAALDQFVDRILDPGSAPETAAFLTELARLAARIRRPGLWNALARTLIQLTAPGVPDLYQGDELWTFTLVDPDNRRPVDFVHRRALLDDLQHRHEGGDASALIRELVEWPEDGRIKLHVIRCTLALRRKEAILFSAGGYHPLSADGSHAEHVLAFARRRDNQTVLAVVPRLVVSLVDRTEQAPLGSAVWGDTRLRLPADLAGRRLTNVLTGETHIIAVTDAGGTTSVPVGAILETCPVALLEAT